MARILVLDAHPVRHKVALYQQLTDTYGHDVTVLYGSDLGTKTYVDSDFGTAFKWDLDLLGGYKARFGMVSSKAGNNQLGSIPCRKLYRTLVSARPEVVLLSEHRSRFYREAIAGLWPLPYPWVLRAEKIPDPAEPEWLTGSVREALRRRVIRRASSVAYVGKRALAHYERLGVPKDKLVFSPYAVATDGFRMEESDRSRLRGPCRERLGIEADRLVLLFAGDLTAHNDPQRLIDAVRCLDRSLRDRIVVLYLGDGALAQELTERARRAPAVEIRILGRPSHWELSPYYHAADMAVLTGGHQETWAAMLNEALHHGLPCLSPDRVCSTADLIVEGITGFSFEAGSTTSLASAITALLPLSGDTGLRTRCRDHAGHYSLAEAGAGLHHALGLALPRPEPRGRLHYRPQ